MICDHLRAWFWSSVHWWCANDDDDDVDDDDDDDDDNVRGDNADDKYDNDGVFLTMMVKINAITTTTTTTTTMMMMMMMMTMMIIRKGGGGGGGGKDLKETNRYSPDWGGVVCRCFGGTILYWSRKPFAVVVLSLWNVIRKLLKVEVTWTGAYCPQYRPNTVEVSEATMAIFIATE